MIWEPSTQWGNLSFYFCPTFGIKHANFWVSYVLARLKFNIIKKNKLNIACKVQNNVQSANFKFFLFHMHRSHWLLFVSENKKNIYFNFSSTKNRINNKNTLTVILITCQNANINRHSWIWLPHTIELLFWQFLNCFYPLITKQVWSLDFTEMLYFVVLPKNELKLQYAAFVGSK